MTPLPVIVGFGGCNAAGRSSFHQSYLRMVIENIKLEQRRQVIAGLAVMMRQVDCDNGRYQDTGGRAMTAAEVVDAYSATVLDNTLVRRINNNFFNADCVPAYKDLTLKPRGDHGNLRFRLHKKQLPHPLPADWRVSDIDGQQVDVTIVGNLDVKVPTATALSTQAVGQLPTGFDPAALYRSRFHPRGLQMTIVGASDAINSIGIDWQRIMAEVAPDQVATYASSAMGQMDEHGSSGLLQARFKSGRVSAKQLPLGFTSMPTDFVNAYVTGNLGATGSMAGACASLLYNLRLGIEDIKTGRRRVVIIGASEAPIIPEIIEGYEAMSALATDKRLRELDLSDTVDYRRASRPFGRNCGFTLAESAQYFVLMDDQLAISLGATIYGAVNDVFVNADGYKRSISSPGAGNYITLAKSVAAAQAIIGRSGVQHHSFVQSHGSSTPKNRVTESIILDKIAAAFDIQRWPVTAVKAYVGHSLAAAGGDQLTMSLGVFAHGLIPGIKTIASIADDVVDDRLAILAADTRPDRALQVAFINAKGFGGNNASASVLAPHIVENMLAKRHGSATMTKYYQQREHTQAKADSYHQAFLTGDYQTIYHFGEHLIDESVIDIDSERIQLAEFERTIDLNLSNPFADMS